MKFIKRIFLITVLIVVTILSLIIYKGYEMYKDGISEINLDTKIIQLRQVRNYVIYDDLPDDYINAVIAVEDRSFFKHNGINLISIFRAIINNIKAKDIVEGGSTITQQVAKNLYFTQEKRLTRKVAEIFLVYDLEKNYEKEDIFELYVNISYFGDGYYGIKEACKGYLNKEPKDMTLLECTLLAGIPNAPSVYAPTKNPDLAVQRQKRVIECMAETGHLEKEEETELLQKLN